MEPVTIITGRAVPLDRSDVDTDQIIPSDWLKRVERTGFGEGLCSEWRESSDFVLNREEYQGDDVRVLVAGADARTVRGIVACGHRAALSLSGRGAIDAAVKLVAALGPVELTEKKGGRSGHWLRDAGAPPDRPRAAASRSPRTRGG